MTTLKKVKLKKSDRPIIDIDKYEVTASIILQNIYVMICLLLHEILSFYELSY